MGSADTVSTSIAVLALLITGLSLHVSRLRLRHRVSFGDGGHKDLLIAIRAHGNALEQTALFAVLALSAVALQTVPVGLLSACAAVFTAARLAHAAAVFGRRLGLRQAAHVASTLVHLVLSVAIIVQVLT